MGARSARALIVGGGISGIGAAIRLRRDAGLDDVVILEKADGLGGTWRHNTYPGCACDIPSALYSFEFAPNPDWRRIFAEGPEIDAYVQRVAVEHGVPECAVLGTEVTSAAWDDVDARWRLRTTTGDYDAPILVFAPGPLHEPKIPHVPGAELFAGESFHSAQWRHDVDLTGKRVVVVGTGPSAIQFVPHVAEQAAHLTVLQRSPGWIIPKFDWRTTALERWVLRRVPGSYSLMRAAQWEFCDFLLRVYGSERIARLLNGIGRAHIRAVVRDRATRKALVPDYTLGCKRIMLSNNFYPALNRPNVDLVPYPVQELRAHSVVAADGSDHEADVVIWATGFHVSDLPFTDRIRGRSGETLAQVWGDNPSAYLGTAISGFPNAFMLFGPNSGTASAFAMLEGQLNHLVAAVRALRENGLTEIEIKPEVQRAYKQECNARLARSTWNAGGCTSYYMDAKGENYSVFPGTQRELVRRGAAFSLDDHITVPAVVERSPAQDTKGTFVGYEATKVPFVASPSSARY